MVFAIECLCHIGDHDMPTSAVYRDLPTAASKCALRLKTSYFVLETWKLEKKDYDVFLKAQCK